MAVQSSIVAAIFLLSCLVTSSNGASFASLPKSLVVTASPQSGQVLHAGKAEITVTWSLNTTFAAGTDSAYRTVKVKLCYAPISQKDRGWRKTEDDLEKDRTCQHKIVAKPYSPSNNNVTWIVQNDVPTATYFVRAYAYDSADEAVAFGQATDSRKSTNLFEIQGISGRHLTLDITSVCFSCFSIVSLIGFFWLEKSRAKASGSK